MLTLVAPMGKCQSCCEAKGPTSGSRYHTPTDYRSRGGPRPVSKELESTSTSIPVMASSRSVPVASDRKIFTPYPKLPPIKKPSNGENKRLSFISRDFSESKVFALFEQYKDPGEDAILAEGVENFCCDLEVNPDDFIVLVLAWKFQAEMMCRFTREEFLHGCKSLKVDSIKGIQSKFTELLTEVQNKQTFKDLYRWTYKFGLDVETGQRTLPIEMAISLWKLVYSQNEPKLLSRWLEFLEDHPSIRGIPRDTWDMYLNFTEQVSDDLSTYDDTEAWPSLFDDFVEYENDRQNQNVKMM